MGKVKLQPLFLYHTGSMGTLISVVLLHVVSHLNVRSLLDVDTWHRPLKYFLPVCLNPFICSLTGCKGGVRVLKLGPYGVDSSAAVAEIRRLQFDVSSPSAQTGFQRIYTWSRRGLLQSWSAGWRACWGSARLRRNWRSGWREYDWYVHCPLLKKHNWLHCFVNFAQHVCMSSIFQAMLQRFTLWSHCLRIKLHEHNTMRCCAVKDKEHSICFSEWFWAAFYSVKSHIRVIWSAEYSCHHVSFWWHQLNSNRCHGVKKIGVWIT